MDYTETQLTEAYNTAPQKVRAILLDERFGAVVQAIGKNNGLTPAQALEVEDVVVHTLLGLETIDTLEARVKKEVDVAEDAIKGVLEDLKENVFANLEQPAEQKIPAVHHAAPIPTPPKPPEEHMFEQKLRAISIPHKPTETPHPAAVEEPSPKEGQTDPYRETL